MEHHSNNLDFRQPGTNFQETFSHTVINTFFCDIKVKNLVWLHISLKLFFKNLTD